MTPDEAERERTALLERLESEGMTQEMRPRVIALAAHDWQHAQDDPTLSGFLGRELALQYSRLISASGIQDAMPASMEQEEDRVYVRSAQGGRVEIGTVDYRALLRVAAAYADELEQKRRRPLEAKAEKSRSRAAEARAMHAAGRSVRYIARSLQLHHRTVQRYLAESRTATNGETPP